MKIAIFSQEISQDVKNVLQSILIHKDAQKCIFFIHNNLSQCKINANNFSFFKNYDDLDKSFDLFISIGGDGTFLRSIEFVRNLNLPIIGVNTGRLGFLASTKKENLEKSLTKIFKKKFNVEKRSILKVSSENKCIPVNSFPYALNEISVVRKDTTSMINVKTSLDGTYVNSYWSDGLIVSTPTGSTGYSLSCGGPIIMPGTNNIIITPNAPHNLNVRPIVIDDNSIIKLKVEDRDQLALVSLDSRSRSFDSSTELIIKKANFKIKLVQPQNNSFTTTIRNKLMWGLDKRS